MARPRLVFAHANGFPAGSYRRLLARLGTDYRVLAPEQLGHDPAYPVTVGWRPLAEQLLDWLAARDTEPVLGVGHSLGGVLMLLAALRQPRRFRALILLDPPLVHGAAGLAVAIARWLGRVDRVTPAARSAQRRRHWPDRATALADLGAKPLFTGFDATALADYVDAATRTDGEGVHLAYDPAVEAAVFRSLPTDLGREPATLGCPGALVTPRSGSVTRTADRRWLARRYALLTTTAPGGHLFPLEYPVRTATLIRALDDRLGRAGEDDGVSGAGARRSDRKSGR